MDSIAPNFDYYEIKDIDELVAFCEEIFEGFKLKKNLGNVDKSRYILEFVK